MLPQQHCGGRRQQRAMVTQPVGGAGHAACIGRLAVVRNVSIAQSDRTMLMTRISYRQQSLYTLNPNPGNARNDSRSSTTTLSWQRAFTFKSLRRSFVWQDKCVNDELHAACQLGRLLILGAATALELRRLAATASHRPAVSSLQSQRQHRTFPTHQRQVDGNEAFHAATMCVLSPPSSFSQKSRRQA